MKFSKFSGLKPRSNKGNAGVIGVAIASFVLLYIGLSMIASVQGSLDRTDWSADMNSTYTNLEDNTTTGYNIGGMYPMVIVAGAMIAALMGYFAMR